MKLLHGQDIGILTLRLTFMFNKTALFLPVNDFFYKAHQLLALLLRHLQQINGEKVDGFTFFYKNKKIIANEIVCKAVENVLPGDV
jgi:hypothetical protein